MSSVLQQLVERSEGGNAGAALRPVADESDGAEREEVADEPAEGGSKTAADRARALIEGSPDLEAECLSTAAGLRGEMEKTASEGGDTEEQESAADFFEKVAQTLRVQRTYAANLEKRATANARTCEALKVASDLMQRDVLEVAEGQTMLEVVEELAKKDLSAVKVASEMFKDAALTNAMGTAEKLASDKSPPRKLDGSMESWTESHDWLFK